MEFQELIRKRFSVRAYQDKPVEAEKLTRILEAARLAPTAANRQPFQLIVISTQERKAELGQIYGREWFVQAPLLICACGVARHGWVRNDNRRYLDVDVAIVMDHLILAAANEGLGTCWVAAFNAQAARQCLGIPEGVEPMIFTPLGYPDETAPEKIRRPLSELVRYENWS